jgi:hypothetical protein
MVSTVDATGEDAMVTTVDASGVAGVPAPANANLHHCRRGGAAVSWCVTPYVPPGEFLVRHLGPYRIPWCVIWGPSGVAGASLRKYHPLLLVPTSSLS